MGIEFTIASKNLSFTRPLGYGFPNGLTGRPAVAGIDAIIIAGGELCLAEVFVCAGDLSTGFV